MNMSIKQHQIGIDVRSQFIEEQSEPDDGRYAFAYTISITNNSQQTVRLLSRYWLITDGNEQQQEVHGEGVVGEQPYIPSGETFEYTSGTLLPTSVGTMEGSYQMLTESGENFEAQIAAFGLVHPDSLH